MLSYCHLEIINYFWASSPVFSCCTRSANYVPDPQCGRQRLGLPQNQVTLWRVWGLHSEGAKWGCHPTNTDLYPHPALLPNMASAIFRPGWGGVEAGQWREVKLGVKATGKALKWLAGIAAKALSRQRGEKEETGWGSRGALPRH